MIAVPVSDVGIGTRVALHAHAATGDLASAIAAYERCRSTLDQDLGISPSPATRQRHAALLAAANGDHPPARAGEQSR
jgi:DNA-binding SARP family transcriptional activator